MITQLYTNTVVINTTFDLTKVDNDSEVALVPDYSVDLLVNNGSEVVLVVPWLSPY